jgi:hypothetical protein
MNEASRTRRSCAAFPDAATVTMRRPERSRFHDRACALLDRVWKVGGVSPRGSRHHAITPRRQRATAAD